MALLKISAAAAPQFQKELMNVLMTLQKCKRQKGSKVA